MAEDNHGQMLIQQQQPPSQQPQLQQSQLQQSQLQQSQLQQSQLQQSQLQQSQLQQSQLQQSQLQQSQLQQSQLQQSQLQQSQLQQSQMQQSQLHQSQLQQSQLQQSQLQQTQMQQSQVQQSQLQTAMCNSSVEHSNMNVATSVPLSVVSVSQSQQMQGIQQSVNTSSGTPVQMAQLAAQGQPLPAGTMMSQSSGPHPTMMHPTMTMAQAPLQQVQVIQQPASYLQHLYNPQMIFPAGNLTLQHAGAPTLQGLGASQGLSLQLQTKTALDPKTSVAQTAVNKGMTVNAGTMMTASGQVIGTASKANFPQQMMSGPGKSTIIHGQSGFAPTNTNQTVVIGQLGVLPNQQSIFNHKTIADSQKGKFTFQSPATLQPKSLYSTPASSAQVFNGLKQMSSQPQIITTQAPGTMFTQAHQLLGLQTLPAGMSWATPGSFQSTLLGQNPIFIRSQQSDMFIQQSQPQAVHLPPAQPQTPISFTPSAIAPQKQKQVRMRPGTHSVAVGTQTQVSNATTMHSNTAPIRSQIKPKVRATTGPSPGPPPTPQMATTQTQTQQPPVVQQPLSQHKTDAGNQTCHRNPDLKSPSAKPVEPVTKQASSQKSQALVAPSAKVQQIDATTTVFTAITTVSSAVPPQQSIASVAMEVQAATVPTLADVPPPQPQSEAGPLRPQQPIGQQVKDKQPPQKAIVKPQVLTHIIDGLVIQEGPEPFPVSRSALLDSPGRILASEKLDSQLKRKDSPAVTSPDKKMKAHRGGPGRKKKVGGFRGRKGFLKEAEIEERGTSQTEDGVSIQMEEEEDGTEAPVDTSQQSSVELEKFDSEKDCGHAQKLATKWSVQDVFEFIRSLPGCCDYADTFRLQEIDGQALLLLKEDHLMTSMSMKLGPALKLISQIRSIKEELAAQS